MSAEDEAHRQEIERRLRRALWRRKIGRRYQWAAVFQGAMSAIFWILSASVTLPPVVTYWGTVPPTDPYQMALQKAAAFNGMASIFAAGAILCQALAVGFENWGRRR